MPRRLVLTLILGLGALALASAAPRATTLNGAALVGSYTWDMDYDRFGGFSGLELGNDGLSFATVSDRGVIVTGRLARDAAGVVTGVQGARLAPLRDAAGTPVSRYQVDAEGLAIAPDGRLYVSFEGDHRVWAYASAGGSAEPLPKADAFPGLQNNSSLEALAIDAQGRLYTLPERSGRLDRPFPVWRWSGTGWSQPFTLPRDGDFLPVGADFGPDGMFYLLERHFRGVFGFRSRVSRFALGADGFGPREVLFETNGAMHDNLEAIAVWRDTSGAIRLTLQSDDNFSPLQHTEFVDYRLGP